MHQLSAPLAEKLDEPLVQLCNGEGGLSPSARVAILVKCERTAMDQIAEAVSEVGGKVRAHLKIVDAIAAWVPLGQIERLALRDGVRFVELEQNFTTA